MRLINQEILLRNPREVRRNAAGDATFLHQDMVFDKLVRKLTPERVYAQNAEIIQSFTRTVVNVSNISVNILDFWNKEPLQQFLEPLDESILEDMPDYQTFDKGISKGFWLRSMINIQDILCDMYLNNLYTTTNNTKHSYTLKIDLERLFKRYKMTGVDKYQILFDNVNDLFTEDRFLVNKEYNMKKGKKIDFAYMTQAAWDAEIEGPLKSPGYDYEYFDWQNDPSGAITTPLEYRIESVLLPQVFRNFVMPMAHPLGFGIDYIKVCKLDFEEDVFTKTRWRASAVTIKCTYPSDTSPIPPPGHNMPKEINPDWVAYNDTQYALDPDYDPYETYDARYPGRQTPPLKKHQSKLPWPGYIPNTESIVQIPLLRGPWDPGSTTTEKVFATDTGFGLWEEISMDEGQGNILKDIEYGVGTEFYLGMNYTKYIFENNNYLIQYECQLEDGSMKREIEYFRYDIFDLSIYYNIIRSEPTPPSPDDGTKNIINGFQIDPLDYPMNKNTEMAGPFTTEDAKTWDALNQEWIVDDPILEKERTGYDNGVWGLPIDTNGDGHFDSAAAVPATFWQQGPHYKVTRAGDLSTDDVCIDSSSGTYYSFDFIASAGQTEFYYATSTSIDVYQDGLLLQDTNYIVSNTSDYLSMPAMTGGEFINIFERRHDNYMDYTGVTGTVINFTPPDVSPNQSFSIEDRVAIHKNGLLLNSSEFSIVNNTSPQVPKILNLEITFNTPLATSDWIHIYELEQERHQSFGVFGTGEIPLIAPVFTSQVFIKGLKIKSIDYHTDGVFVNPVQTWDVDTNTYNADERFTDVYTLIGRWIEYRGCIINVYDLEKTTEQSITDELDIKRVVLQQNIIHRDKITGEIYNTFNDKAIQEDASIDNTNIVNKFQKVQK